MALSGRRNLMAFLGERNLLVFSGKRNMMALSGMKNRSPSCWARRRWIGRLDLFECVGCGGLDSVMDEGELLGGLGELEWS